MRTVGERIRQARAYRGLTGAQLATRVGYNNQSAIGNLENRVSGRGGFRMPKIAEVLGFPLQWFLEGPDYEDLADLERALRDAGIATPARGSDRQQRVNDLLQLLTEEGADRAEEYLELLQHKYARQAETDAAALERATVKPASARPRKKRA